MMVVWLKINSELCLAMVCVLKAKYIDSSEDKNEI